MTEDFARCQGCGAPLALTVVDLGLSPLANSYATPETLEAANRKYPLHVRFCENCFLVQVDRLIPRETIFSDYAYFSSYSESWLDHCRVYAVRMTDRFNLDARTKVIEVASNDGYLLQFFQEAGVPVLGIEPAANVAKAAIARSIPTEVAFFGAETARRLVERGDAADFLGAKNVLAHVPDINDFVQGVSLLMKPDAVFSVEFPHLLKIIQDAQFDTIYHEHFTYLSILAVEQVFSRWGLRIFDVEEIPTHGGSLHVLACHEAAGYVATPNVGQIRQNELAAKLDRPEGYEGFAERVIKVKSDLLSFFAEARAANEKVAAYGAAAKGNTLLNYCGIGPDSVAFVADRSPAKQSKLLPGSLIEIRAPDAVFQFRPDYLLILPWNLREEIESQMSGIREWGGRFVTAIPEIRID